MHVTSRQLGRSDGAGGMAGETHYFVCGAGGISDTAELRRGELPRGTGAATCSLYPLAYSRSELPRAYYSLPMFRMAKL